MLSFKPMITFVNYSKVSSQMDTKSRERHMVLRLHSRSSIILVKEDESLSSMRNMMPFQVLVMPVVTT